MASLIDRLFGRTDEPAAEQEGEEMSEEEAGTPPNPIDPPDEPAPPDGGPVLDDLRARLDELETGVEHNESTMRAIESNQEELSESVDEIHDTIRRLLGVYDRLTAQENPFDAGEPAGNGRFGVVGEPRDTDESPGSDPGDADAPADDGADHATNGSDERVSFDDLLADEEESPAPPGDADPAAETGPDGADDGQSEPGAEAAQSEPGAEAGESKPAPAHGPGAQSDGLAVSLGDGGGPTQVQTLPRGYAAEAVVMEWLATLVMTSGPAGAVKAIAFYEEVGWIGSGVRNALEEYLSGPGLDVQVDPNCPVELTAEDHAESYEYVLQLNTLEGITTDFGEQA